MQTLLEQKTIPETSFELINQSSQTPPYIYLCVWSRKTFLKNKNPTPRRYSLRSINQMKRRFFKFSDAELICLRRPSPSPTPRTITTSPSSSILAKPPFYRFFQSSPPSNSASASAKHLISNVIGLFVHKLTINDNSGSNNNNNDIKSKERKDPTNKISSLRNNNNDLKSKKREDLVNKISSLRDELLQNVDMVFQILEETKKDDPSLLTNSSAFLELLKLLLLSSPKVALKVCCLLLPFIYLVISE